MLRLTDPVETFHPEGIETPCPPEPSRDPYDWEGWLRWTGSGQQPGRPGDHCFIPDEESHDDDSDRAAPADQA
jgi:hypothetical protein